MEVRALSADKMNFSDLKKSKYTHLHKLKECLGVHREIETELENNNCLSWAGPDSTHKVASIKHAHRVHQG